MDIAINLPESVFSALRKAPQTTGQLCIVHMVRNSLSYVAYKDIYLAIANLSKKWTMPIRDWKTALNPFAIEFEGRFPL